MPDQSNRSDARARLESEIAEVLTRLFPIMRSLTGEGVRTTHDILAEIAPLQRIEVASGTEVFDWTVPKEWVFREAYVTGPDGKRVIDARDHNLHVVNYSVPFRGKLTRAELDTHLHSLPEKPDAIPYVTSYYAPDWGFCLSQRAREALPEGDYEVVVDSDLIEGSLTLSEAVLPGESEQEVLFSSYTCHPSMANDELCAPVALAFLLRHLASRSRRRLTYRFVFLPETIGSITYLSLRGDHLKRHLVAGYCLANIGVAERFCMKRSRRGDSLADRAAAQVLRRGRRSRDEPEPKIMAFEPFGSDERQYCAPGFNLPVVALTRGEIDFPEYHSSLDNLDIVSPRSVAATIDTLAEICNLLDGNRRYRNLKPHGEPHLSKHGLYPTLGSRNDRDQELRATLWLLNLADGEHDLLATAERSGLPFDLIAAVAEKCLAAGLLEEL